MHEIKTLNQFIEKFHTLTCHEIHEWLSSFVNADKFLGEFDPEESAIAKIWSRQDIKQRLEDSGYQIPDDDTLEAIFMDALVDLEDCTDWDWQIIDNSIESYKDDLTSVG